MSLYDFIIKDKRELMQDLFSKFNSDWKGLIEIYSTCFSDVMHKSVAGEIICSIVVDGRMEVTSKAFKRVSNIRDGVSLYNHVEKIIKGYSSVIAYRLIPEGDMK